LGFSPGAGGDGHADLGPTNFHDMGPPNLDSLSVKPFPAQECGDQLRRRDVVVGLDVPVIDGKTADGAAVAVRVP